MIERLVAFDTTSRKSNLELVDYVRDYLGALGVECELVHGPEPDKANLYATLGPTDRGGIALSGHTDVVPIDGQVWSSDPWRVTERDGRLYGRGTCDMKSFLAVALAFAPRFLERGLETPIHYCLSFDEELGCRGVPYLLEALAERPVRPRACIIGEPTEMRVVTGHKGKLSGRCRVRGLACHSSLAPKGVNAVEAAAKMIVKLSEMAERKAREGPFDADYDVPHSTVNVGPIAGGTALNIVPAECEFEFEFRCLIEDNAETLLEELSAFARDKVEPAMRAVAPETGIEVEAMSSFPGLELAPETEIVTLVKALAGANSTGKVAFGTEAGLFQTSGIPAVICGPGSIEQAHKADEYVALDQVALCERFMARLLERVTATR